MTDSVRLNTTVIFS